MVPMIHYFCPLIPGDVTSGTKDAEIKVVTVSYTHLTLPTKRIV